MTILTLPGRSSSTGPTSTIAIVAIELELVGERRPLLRQWRSLRAMQRDLEDAEAEDRALQPDRRQRDADLLEQIFLRQCRDLGRAAPLDHLCEHRGGRLRDRAAAALELHVVDRVAVVAERDVDGDLVAAQRVLPLRARVGVDNRPVPARVLVVIE